MSDNFQIFTNSFVQSVSNIVSNGSELVKDSETVYPKIKTLIEGDGVILTNTDNSIEISTTSSTVGTLRGISTGLPYATVLVSTIGPEPAESTLVFPSVSGELASNYNTITGVLTVPTTGNYLVSFSSRYAIVGDINIEVRVDGTPVGIYSRTNGGGGTGAFVDFSFTLPFEFNENDNVSLVIKAATDPSAANYATRQMEFSISSLG